MALNPQLLPNGMPIAFVNEMFVLVRDGVEFEVDKIPGFVFPSIVSHVIHLLQCFFLDCGFDFGDYCTRVINLVPLF